MGSSTKSQESVAKAGKVCAMQHHISTRQPELSTERSVASPTARAVPSGCLLLIESALVRQAA